MNRNFVFYNELKGLIISNVLSISSAEIDKMYDYWELNKNNERVENFNYQDRKIHKTQNVPHTGASLKGIDLPTWFGDYKMKKVMILGIDPLRNKGVFDREKADPDKDVIIGTPYALHELKARKGACATYWNFIEGLSENHFVYCTDIYKTYYLKSDNTRSYNDKEYIESSGHKTLLLSEIELIKPDIIIAFGNIVESLLKGLDLSIKIIKLPHPSNANRSWNTRILGKATTEEKVKCLNSLFYKEFVKSSNN
jgi:hypothetical protein